MPTIPERIDLATTVLGVSPEGDARVVEYEGGPPPRVRGFTVSAPAMTREPPHAGEMHPDGDEIVFLISGRIVAVLEDHDPPRHVELSPGQAIVIPRGVWHRIKLVEPSQLLHVTPGPGGEHRPLP